MCEKYINATTRCYKSATYIDDYIRSYNVPFSDISHDTDANGDSIGDFILVTMIDFLGTGNEAHKEENPLESRKKLDFIIRLTKCSSDKDKRIGYDLDTFSIDLDELHKKNQVNQACFEYLNYTRTTKVDKLVLPGGVGKYVIKVLVKESDKDGYSIQTMSPLVVV